MLRFCGLLPAALALGLIPAMTEAELLPVRTFNASDGLAEGRINAIREDARGFIWVATSGGLSRFDGYRFVTWSERPEILYRGAYSLLATRGGDYWVGTGQGLLHFESGGPLKSSLLTPSTGSKAVGRLLPLRSGRIIASTGDGLVWIDGERIVRLPLTEIHGAGRRLGAVAEDLSGDLWVGAPPDGISIYGAGKIDQAPIESVALPAGTRTVNAILEAPAGTVWVAIDAGLLRYERQDGVRWKMTGTFNQVDGLPAREVTRLLARSDGTIWAGTTHGLARFAEADAAHPHFTLPGDQRVRDKNVTALLEDRGGNLWVGSDAGLVLVKAHGFTTWQGDDGVADGALLEVFEDRDGTILAVGDGYGRVARAITLYESGRFHQRDATAMFGPSAAPWVSGPFVIRSRSGEWWAAASGGLCRYPAVAASALADTKPEECFARGEQIHHVFEDSRGDVWASDSRDYGLLRWSHDSNRISYIAKDGSESVTHESFGELIDAMAEDGRGNLWFGAQTGGLYRFRREVKSDARVAHFTQGDSLDAILSLYVSETDQLWVASQGGLIVTSEPAADHPQFRVYNSANGFPADSAGCLTEDRFGNIWAGTTRGIVSLNPATGATQLFTQADGLPEAIVRSAIQDRTGALWFATSRGVTRIVPQNEKESAPPEPLLTDVRIADEEYPVAALGTQRIDRVVLGPERNRVQIEFAAPGGNSPDRLRYRVYLAGANGGWSAPQTDNRVDYRSLRAGTYSFQVKAVNLSGVESASAAEFDFRILPPVWLRWWFLIPALCVVAALFWWMQQYRISRALAIERMRTDIATDLHDDIGASLTRIAILSDMGSVNREAESFSRIGGMARELLDSLNDIVWSVRATEVKIDSLVGRMREFALDVLAKSGAEFHLECDDALRARQLSPDTRRHLLLIFKECLHNIAKHSGCTRAEAVLEMRERQLVMTVSDNGRGVDGSEVSKGGNGIPGMKRRALTMNGEIEFGVAPGGGHRVTVRVPMTARGQRA